MIGLIQSIKFTYEIKTQIIIDLKFVIARKINYIYCVQMGKNLVIVLLAVTALIYGLHFATQQTQGKDEFMEWKERFGAKWTPVEDAYRKMVFMNNLKKFAQHNADPTQTFKMGITQFTAMTQQQFQLTYLHPKPFNPEWQTSDLTVPEINGDIDWTEKGIISPVKFMGNCGAGWAFSAVASLETLALTKNQTIILSEQQLVDCSLAYGNLGCGDGDNYQALNYVKDRGIQTLDAYPYIQKMQKCKMQGGPFKISGWHYVKGCKQLAETILERPLGVSVDATQWPHYKSGIFGNCDDTLNINLDVYLVGATSTYWKIKNAWGTTWGEDGYIRLKHTNTCGMCVDKSPWAY